MQSLVNPKLDKMKSYMRHSTVSEQQILYFTRAGLLTMHFIYHARNNGVIAAYRPITFKLILNAVNVPRNDRY